MEQEIKSYLIENGISGDQIEAVIVDSGTIFVSVMVSDQAGPEIEDLRLKVENLLKGKYGDGYKISAVLTAEKKEPPQPPKMK